MRKDSAATSGNVNINNKSHDVGQTTRSPYFSNLSHDERGKLTIHTASAICVFSLQQFMALIGTNSDFKEAKENFDSDKNGITTALYNNTFRQILRQSDDEILDYGIKLSIVDTVQHSKLIPQLFHMFVRDNIGLNAEEMEKALEAAGCEGNAKKITATFSALDNKTKLDFPYYSTADAEKLLLFFLKNNEIEQFAGDTKAYSKFQEMRSLEVGEAATITTTTTPNISISPEALPASGRQTWLKQEESKVNNQNQKS